MPPRPSSSVRGSSITGCGVGVENTDGPFLAGGAAAYLSSGAKIRSSQTLYASSVYLSSGASLGPIDTNNVMRSSGATYGKVSTFPQMPAAPAAPSATAGTSAVTVSAGASKTLASGAYGSVTVNSGATLKLTGGTYVFSSLTLSSGATLTVSAPTVLSVTGAASFSSTSSLGPASGSGLTAKALAVYFDGSSGINVTSGAKVRALFVAPKALVTVSTSSFTGAITAAQVLMNAGATVTCEDGLGRVGGLPRSSRAARPRKPVWPGRPTDRGSDPNAGLLARYGCADAHSRRFRDENGPTRRRHK